jgi:hypothetical protein
VFLREIPVVGKPRDGPGMRIEKAMLFESGWLACLHPWPLSRGAVYPHPWPLSQLRERGSVCFLLHWVGEGLGMRVAW